MEKRTGKNAAPEIDIGEMKVGILKYEQSSKYLGRLVSFQRPHEVEVENRISAAWGAFHTNKRVLCNKALFLKHRVEYF